MCWWCSFKASCFIIVRRIQRDFLLPYHCCPNHVQSLQIHLLSAARQTKSSHELVTTNKNLHNTAVRDVSYLYMTAMWQVFCCNIYSHPFLLHITAVTAVSCDSTFNHYVSLLRQCQIIDIADCSVCSIKSVTVQYYQRHKHFCKVHCTSRFSE